MLNTVSKTPTVTRVKDHEADAECLAMLDRAQELRRELRDLEPKLHVACNAFGRRRGMIGQFNEWNVRNTAALEEAAERDAWEKANV
jgi:hypothetical protein